MLKEKEARQGKVFAVQILVLKKSARCGGDHLGRQKLGKYEANLDLVFSPLPHLLA